MDFTNYNNLLKRREEQPRDKGIHSYNHAVTWEVCKYVDERKKFGKWLGIVNRHGAGQIKELLNRMKEKGITDAKYLMGCVRRK